MFGGDLHENEIFSHILSIGFEFETHDLAKMSLQKDNILLNTDTVPRVLKTQLKENNATKLDDYNYEIFESAYSNDSFVELFDIPIIEQGKINNNFNVVMNVATDISNTEFAQNLYPLCKDIKSNKNNLYTFKTQETNYKIHFSDDLIHSSRCSDFSGVEYIVTYFNPKKNKNIIVETFFNACSLIMNHLNLSNQSLES